MDKIEIELELKSITDKINSVADGLKETRSVNFIDTEGNGISLTITANKDSHPMEKWNKAMMLETGVSQMSLTLPKTKQITIDTFGDKDEEKPKVKPKRGRPAKKEDIDAINKAADNF